MSAVPTKKYTFGEYLARERLATIKSEFYRGEIFAMAGGSLRHNTISGNAFTLLRNGLRGSPCRPLNSGQRIRIATNTLSTYPDVSIICGEIKVDQEDQDAIVNPRVIFEVISRSTESYDRGKKFDLYRQLESLQEYVLVSQDEPQVDRFTRQNDGSWNLTITKGLENSIKLISVSCVLPVAGIYEDVTFDPEEAVSGVGIQSE